jgi:excinuclease ABC subunit A
MSADELIIEGAKQNNLRSISLKLPHNRVIAVTGLSGSGKSSLAFDTIFAEGQWRFIESLSTYARLFLEKLDRPDVESIHNIRPAVALEQVNRVKGSRSTVGTSTEIYDYLRLLYAKIGRPRCPRCGSGLKVWTTSSVVQELLEKYSESKAFIIFNSDDDPEELRKKGFHRVLVGGKVKDISELISHVSDSVNRNSGTADQRSYKVVLDRLVIRDEPRLSDSVETAWEHGHGRIMVELVRTAPEENESLLFSSEFRCLKCDREITRPQPLLFSFNHPLGACPVCKGFGNTLEYSEDSVVPDQELTVEQGAIEPWSKPAYRWWYRQFAKAAKAKGMKLNVPYKKLSKKTKELIFRGNSECYGLNEFFEELERKRYKLHVRVFLSRYRRPVRCAQCGGSRLQPDALAYSVGGRSVAEVAALSVTQLNEYLSVLCLSDHEREVASEILGQLQLKVDFLLRVGLGYLTLDRQSKTLSGGESQRISLANQLASKLTGTLYVLDEPTIGLHPRDVSRVTAIIRELSEIGNTIIVVEHDRTVIESSDWVVELGPGSGRNGGNLMFSGLLKDFLRSRTLTANYLNRIETIPGRLGRRKGSGNMLQVRGAHGHNLRHIDVSIPLQTFVCVSGVSGSGKSTLVKDTIYNAVSRLLRTEFERPLPFESLHGTEHLKGIRIIDQRPIGKSPRSNPVTYIKAFDPIRKLFSQQAQAQHLGYGPGHFSFNSEAGRCEVCTGDGFQKLEMYFFEDLYIRCEECEGRRYKPDILKVTYNGKTIHDVLELTVDEAIQFFSRVPSLIKRLKLMSSVGLGYLKLGQPATTLSGGEAQRLKICAELGIAKRQDYLYILDEPTVGLHPDDIKKLLEVLGSLVNAGNTVLLVEHNLDVIKCADWIIDMGPEGGEEGGAIVAQGTPRQVARQKRSYTGRFLKEYLNK